MNVKINFAETELMALPVPGGCGIDTYWDTITTGFGISVDYTGKRQFFIRGNLGLPFERPKYLEYVIGEVGLLPLENVRARAKILSEIMKDGHTPTPYDLSGLDKLMHEQLVAHVRSLLAEREGLIALTAALETDRKQMREWLDARG